MCLKNYFGKYINFSLISNCVVFNTLAGCNKKKGGKGCSSSGKDKKDPTIINNEQGTSGDENNKLQDDEEKKKRKREEQEKADKLVKENTEKLALENKKDGLKMELKKLKEALDSLNGVENKFFEINVFKIDSTENEIKNCDKNTIGSIEQKLNTDKTNFDNKLQNQIGVLKDKYRKFKNQDEKNIFNVKPIEEIIKKDKLDVNEFISLNSQLVSYEQFVKNGLPGFIKNFLNQYKEKDKYKKKYKLAKAIDSTFESHYEEIYDSIKSLTEFNKIQNNVNIVSDEDKKADKIINDKKSALDNDITVKKAEYKTLFSEYLLEEVKIAPKNFDDLNINNFTEVDHLNNINIKLTELNNEIENIKKDFVTFFITEFKKILEKTTGFNLIDLIGKFFIIKKSETYKNQKELSDKLDEAVKMYLDKNIFANDIYIKLINDEESKTKLIKYNCYDSFVSPTCIDLGNDDNIINKANKYSAYYTFENFINDNDKKSGTDELKNIHIKYDDLIKGVDDDKSYVLFYIRIPDQYNLYFKQYNLFLFISKKKSLGDFFRYDYIENIKITKFKVLEISKNIKDLSCFFKHFKNLEEIDLSKFDTTNVTDMESMFEDCESLKEINFHDTFNTKNVTNMKYMFRNCKNLQKIDLSKFDTTNVTDMVYMFENCKKLQKIDCINKLDATNVINMGSMFKDCKSLANINLSNFKTSEVTDMKSMFEGCESLKEINFSKTFNTKNVTDMEYMFRDCKSLTNIDLSNFETSEVTNMRSMFYGCILLDQINLSENFKTSNVNDMSFMFESCKNLKNLDLSSFDTLKVGDLSYMFSGCESLQKIIFPTNFTIKKGCKTKDMFKYCKNLEDINKEAKDKLKENKDIFEGTKIIDK